MIPRASEGTAGADLLGAALPPQPADPAGSAGFGLSASGTPVWPGLTAAWPDAAGGVPSRQGGASPPLEVQAMPAPVEPLTTLAPAPDGWHAQAGPMPRAGASARSGPQGGASGMGDGAGGHGAPTDLSGVTLAGLVAARLCHDLVSPLGAIGNGVELMQLVAPAGVEPPEELALISESVVAARSRLAGFRVAFGMASGEQRVSKGDLQGLIADVIAAGRLRVDLDSQGDQSRAEVKLVLLALMCLETALPWGGRVLILRAAPGWRLVAEATRTRPDPALWTWLGGDPDLRRPNPLPAEVQFPLLAAEVHAQGRRIEWDVDETGAELVF